MPLKFALAGNPNSGKTTLFNQLTGSTAHVGNWPGVTVERKEGKYRKVDKSAEPINIIDLPGIYSLSPYTPEEVIARNYIINENPDLIINIVDATNLERNLYLTTQIMEMGRPVVVALNMMDVVKKQNDHINIAALQKVLGVPVVGISASKNQGIKELMEFAAKEAEKPRSASSVLLDTPLGDGIREIEKLLAGQNIAHPLYYAVKIIEGDKDATARLNLGPVATEVEVIRRKTLQACEGGDAEAAIADYRYQYITKNCSPLLKKSPRKDNLTISDKVDRIITNRILGIPIFLAIMLFVFHLVFTESLFGIPDVPGPGVWLANILTGWIDAGTEALAGVLEAAGASAWAQGLVIDGICAGVGAVVGFLPLILILYLFLSILEDSGYMARAAFIMDRLLRRFGLSGKSFVPMLMGFGCSVPAMSATRTLNSEKDRKLTAMLIPFMSCGAKLPIYTIIGAALFADNADFVVFGMYLLGIIVAILAGIILKKTVFKGEADPFIMEMPAYHLPRLKSLLIHLWEKLKGFAIKAGTIILGSTIVIWFLSNFNFSFVMVDPNSAESMLGVIGNFVKFIFVPLGFINGPDGWKAAVAVLTGLIAKEVVVSTMGQLYNPGVEGDALEDEGAASALSVTLAASFSPLAALSFMAFNLLSIPCMAAVGALSEELNSKKWFWFTLAFWVVTAWVVSFLIFNIGALLFPALAVTG
jgi:ferrous iron transport protein B